MNFTILLIVLLTCWANYGNSQVSKLTSKQQAKQGADKTAALYDLIRGIAFPEQPKLDNQANKDSRFILMMPGKILNYFDYYPGKEYTKFIQEYSTNAKESVVPPRVMEKWFDLADVMPSAHPLYGQDSGRSLANEYAAVLRGTTVTNLEQQGEQISAAYNQAVAFLKEELVPDPEDVSVNATRLSLYERYRDQYNDRKLEMEDQIEYKRKKFRSLDYELWFQRNYPSLLSKVESAHTRWLVFGEKQRCDLYITSLDSGTSAKNLEDARVSLRSSGVSSLDRTRTIYPVSFEPSDWYKYLLPKYQGLSRAQLNQIKGKLSAKISVINRMILFYEQPHSSDRSYKKLSENYRKHSNVSGHVQEYLNAQLDCMYQSMTSNNVKCGAYDNKSAELLKKVSTAATAMANRDDYVLNPGTKKDFLQYLNNQKQKLLEEQTKVVDYLGKASPIFGSILNADQLTIANLSDSYMDDNWQKFNFDSDFNYGGQGSSTPEFVRPWQSVSRYEQELMSSRMKAKGKLLRVNIKRPWFKPEVFEDSSLNFVEGNDDGANTYVAPGKGLTEERFIAARNGEIGRRQYRLSEYVTSFLLARDIELSFSDVKSGIVKETIKRVSGSFSFLFFHSHRLELRNSHSTQVTTSRNANGMTIKIPGAQVIGYYMQKLPKFPDKQD